MSNVQTYNESQSNQFEQSYNSSEFNGPWHKQNTIQQQIELIRKTYGIQNQINYGYSQQTQHINSKQNSQFNSKRSIVRKLSSIQDNFIERQIYDESRQISKFIEKIFQNKQKTKQQKPNHFRYLISQKNQQQNLQSNSQSRQGSQESIDNITNKIVRTVPFLQKSYSKPILHQQKKQQKLQQDIFELPYNKKSYFSPELFNNNTPKKIEQSEKLKYFMNKTSKAQVWKLNNYNYN